MHPALKQRLVSGLVMGLLLLLVALALPDEVAMAVLIAVSTWGLWEFYSLLDQAKIPNFRILGLACGCVLLVCAWARILSIERGRYFEWDLFATFAITFAVFLRQFYQRNNPRPLETMAGTLMGILYVPFLLMFFVKILMSWGDSNQMQGRPLLLYMIAVVKATDIGAYFIGCSFGRHKLIPRISPAKSWEGVIGGLLTGLGVSVLIQILLHGEFGPIRMHLHDALILGLLLPFCGIVGDLAESMLKRAAGAKDSGATIAGMGGILDVIDSLILAGPVLYFYAKFFLEKTGG